MRALATLALVGLAAGCGPKTPTESAGSTDTSAPITAQMPDTSNARAFASRLVQTTISNWSPISGGDVELDYNSMTFAPDGSWTATATMEAAFEEFDCQETGTWIIDTATADDTATMDWEIGRTTCPMREAGSSLRVQMTIERKGEYQISFR